MSVKLQVRVACFGQSVELTVHVTDIYVLRRTMNSFITGLGYLQAHQMSRRLTSKDQLK